jgi:hypothetical protein
MIDFVVNFLKKYCCAIVMIVKIFQIGGSFYHSDYFKGHGGKLVLFNLIFMKSKLKNRLTIHFDLVVKKNWS